MAEKPAAEKTEQPTQRRLNKVREEGQVAHSEELPAVTSIIVLIIVLFLSAPYLLNWFKLQMEQGLSGDIRVFSSGSVFTGFFNTKILDSICVMLPLFAALAAGSVLSCVIVSGLNFAPQALVPKLSEIDPVKGFEKLFNIKSLIKLGISIAKLLVVAIVVWFYLSSRIESLTVIQWSEPSQILVAIGRVILGLLIRAGLALLVIAALDVFFQKWKYNQELKMTKQELKQELKDTEGSPEIKLRIRRIQIEMTKKRMLEDVSKANVVIVNPTHVAVALRYDSKTMDAPTLAAKGMDHIAEKIREIAIAHGIPIISRPELARTIYSTVKIGESIPEKLYAAVAEVLAMVHRLRHRKT